MNDNPSSPLPAKALLWLLLLFLVAPGLCCGGCLIVATLLPPPKAAPQPVVPLPAPQPDAREKG